MQSFPACKNKRKEMDLHTAVGSLSGNTYALSNFELTTVNEVPIIS